MLADDDDDDDKEEEVTTDKTASLFQTVVAT